MSQLTDEEKEAAMRRAWRFAADEYFSQDVKAWDSLDPSTRQVLSIFAGECIDIGFKTARQSTTVVAEERVRWWSRKKK